MVLVVIFDNRTSLGLVRLRIKKASDELEKIFAALAARSAAPGAGGRAAKLKEKAESAESWQTVRSDQEVGSCWENNASVTMTHCRKGAAGAEGQ